MIRTFLIIGILCLFSCKNDEISSGNLHQNALQFNEEFMCICLQNANGSFISNNLLRCLQELRTSNYSYNRKKLNLESYDIIEKNDTLYLITEKEVILKLSMGSCLRRGATLGVLYKIVKTDSMTYLASPELRKSLNEIVHTFLEVESIDMNLNNVGKPGEMPRITIIRIFKDSTGWNDDLLYSDHKETYIDKILDRSKTVYEKIIHSIDEDSSNVEVIFPVMFFEQDQIESYKDFESRIIKEKTSPPH